MMDVDGLLEKLKEFARLKPGWDGYGGHPIHADVLRDARRLIVVELPVGYSPCLLPCSSGNIQFEWEVDGRELELEIERGGKGHYLKYIEARDDDDVYAEEDTYDLSGTEKTHELFKWLRGVGY